MMIPFAKIGLAATAVALGTAGVLILTSDDAKKVYTRVTAAALRAKDAMKDAASDVARSCSEILDDAVAYNEERAAAREAEAEDLEGDEIVAEAWEDDAESEIVEDAEPSGEDTPDDDTEKTDET